jgi:hypothetical protein
MKISRPWWQCGQISGSIGGIGFGAWIEQRGDGLRRWIDLEWRLELQHLPHAGGVVALRWMPQAEVADLMEAAWQHVPAEAAHELAAAEAAGSCVAGLAVLVSDADKFDDRGRAGLHQDTIAVALIGP